MPEFKLTITTYKRISNIRLFLYFPGMIRLIEYLNLLDYYILHLLLNNRIIRFLKLILDNGVVYIIENNTSIAFFITS